MRVLKAVLLLLTFAGALLAQEKSAESSPASKLADGLYAEFTTPHGVILAELFDRQVPMTVANFVGLAEGTLGPKNARPYYTGLKWYRVVPGFVIQSGNPKAPAEGDAGYTFPDEFSPGLRHDQEGILSMANAGPDTNSGEFFITLGDQTRLNYLHSVFGRVVRGVNLLKLIKPDEPFSIKILRIGSATQAFRTSETSFKALVAQARPYHGEKEPGPTAHFADPDKQLPPEPPRARGFNYKLNNFERTTGERIVARIFAKAPSAAEDAVPGAYMHALAEKLGVAKRGVLAAYFASDDDWRIWIGDESTAVFLGRTASPQDLVQEGALHNAKEAFLESVRLNGEAAILALKMTSPARKEPSPSQRLKLQSDVMLDALILKLEPAPKQ